MSERDRESQGAGGTVYLVDDEEMVVTSLESYLQLETRHRVRTFVSPERALEAVEEDEPDVMVADFMMPGMDGIELLKAVRGRRPAASRILLTGYADKENAIRAINEADIYQYVEKPWENERLELIIHNAVERARLIRDLDARMEQLEEAHGELADLRRRLVETFL
ncbi:MAG: response regulator [Candidatus Palauibacterales bacterium]|nr:response regulator [Candidatus Palauibacterales bacterium]